MSTKVNPEVKSGSNATKRTISAGETFTDGMMIELVSGSSGLDKPDFLLWNGKKASVGTHIKHGGRTYEAPELGPSLYRATRFPSRCDDYDSAPHLFAAIADLFMRRLDLPERESRLLTCFSISTWLADRLPSAPSLAISGPSQELGIDVLRLLSCVCRHPLMLAEVTPVGFRSFRLRLPLTLLLDQQELKPNMQRLFRASSRRGLRVPGNGGSVVDPYGPIAILFGNDAVVDTLGGGVIHISVTPPKLQSSALDEQVQNEIANDFQPRLLMYRLKNHGKVSAPRIEVPEFTFDMRQLARSVAMCFPEDTQLAREAVQLLRPQDEEVRGQRSRDVNCATVEILFGNIHQRKQRAVRVDELAKDLNALLQSRGELIEYSAAEIGWKLKGLG
ncbi:MAG: hypothetical protein WA607_16850, partial [Candidatus Sulfotelmatobacter sp.]